MTRRARWLLGASLAANAFLIGLLGVSLVRPMLPRLTFPAEVIEQRIGGRVDGDDRAAVTRAFAARRDTVAQAQAEFRRQLVEAVRIAGQEPLDVSALRAAVEQATASRRIAADGLVDAILEAFATMSPEGRKKMMSGVAARLL